MANKKITELADLPSPDGADILAIVDDVVGTATTKKVTATNLMGLAPVQSVAGRTGAVTLTYSDIGGNLADSALRGTNNPHIGAFPNQSLKVIDNPEKSVVVVADGDGNLDFVVKSDSSKVYLNTPSSRAEFTTGVSVVEDSTEPDIEITTSSGTYSLISGDSDSLGTNSLPTRQGFNGPDIGANPAAMLISGGFIT